MTRLAVTATDLDRADRLLARVSENDRNEVAKLLAEIREEILTCAAIRAERAAAGVLHDAAVVIAEMMNDVNNPRMSCTPTKTIGKRGGRRATARTTEPTTAPTTDVSEQPKAAPTAGPKP